MKDIKLKIDLKNINNYTREFKIDVAWENIEGDFNDTLKKFSKKVKLPGFRPGKIPRDRLLQQFQPNIEAQFMDDNINKFYLMALQQEELVPINRADISDVQFRFEGNFSFVAKFEVEPEFDLPKLKNGVFKVQRNNFISDDSDIDDAIDQLRRSHARIESVEDGAIEKDFILCDLQKLDDSGVAIIGKKFEKQMLKVGDGSFTEDQKEKLTGLKPGDKSKINLPDNENKDIKSPYELSVNKVEREILPDVNDDFLKLVNPDLKSIDDLRSDVSAKIKENFLERSKQAFERELSDSLIAKVSVDAPPSMIDNYLNNLIEDAKKQNNGQEVDESKLKENYRPAAERNLKWYLIRKKLIEEKEIKVEREDVDEEVEFLVKRSPASEKEIRRFYKKPSNRQRIEDGLIERKVLKYLEQYAKVKEVDVNTKDLRGENK